MLGFVGYCVGPQNDCDPATATNSWWGAALIEVVHNGSMPEAGVDDMVCAVPSFPLSLFLLPPRILHCPRTVL
ncbi:hypothetical protein B0H11DRAFT_2087617, partial [Mycena galericulata]